MPTDAHGAQAKIVRFLFNDQMARAIVEGRKTVTRRPLLDAHGNIPPSDAVFRELHLSVPAAVFDTRAFGPGVQWSARMPCVPGDLLIGRECFAAEVVQYDAEGADDDGTEAATAEFVYYRATPREGLRRWIEPRPAGWEQPARMTYLDDSTPLCYGPASRVKKWRPSIHMPDWAARIRRRVLSVTVERVQDITEEDAVREGPEPAPGSGSRFLSPLRSRQNATQEVHNARQAFRLMWDSIYAAKGLGWFNNPWAWRIEFGAESVGVDTERVV